MKQYTILVVLLAFTAVFAIEYPSKDSKVVFIDIIRSGDKIAEAEIVGVVNECFYGRTVNCTEGGYEIIPCDGTSEETTSDTEVKREVFECGEDCECGASIPSDGIFVQMFEGEVCTDTPGFFIFGLLDTCIHDSIDTSYMYTVDNTTFKISSYETETCEGTSETSFEATLGQCTFGGIVLLTNDLEEPTEPVDTPESVDTPELDGSVATWIASVALIVLSVVVSA